MQSDYGPIFEKLLS